MDKLRPVDEVALRLWKSSAPQIAEELQADREATVGVCWGAVKEAQDIVNGMRVVFLREAEIAILSVAKPPEDPRERLGRAVREAWVKWHDEKPHPKESWCITWEFLDEDNKEMDRQIGDAVLAEQRKIEEEEDSDV